VRGAERAERLTPTRAAPGNARSRPRAAGGSTERTLSDARGRAVSKVANPTPLAEVVGLLRFLPAFVYELL